MPPSRHHAPSPTGRAGTMRVQRPRSCLFGNWDRFIMFVRVVVPHFSSSPCKMHLGSRISDLGSIQNPAQCTWCLASPGTPKHFEATYSCTAPTCSLPSITFFGPSISVLLYCTWCLVPHGPSKQLTTAIAVYPSTSWCLVPPGTSKQLQLYIPALVPGTSWYFEATTASCKLHLPVHSITRSRVVNRVPSHYCSTRWYFEGNHYNSAAWQSYAPTIYRYLYTPSFAFSGPSCRERSPLQSLPTHNTSTHLV